MVPSSKWIEVSELYWLNTPHEYKIDSATTLTDIRKKAMIYLRKRNYETLWISEDNGVHGIEIHYYDNAYIWRDWKKGVRAKIKADGSLTEVINVPPAPMYGKKRPSYRVYIRRRDYDGLFDTDYVYGSITDARKMMYALCTAGYEVSGDRCSSNGYFYSYSVARTSAGVFWGDTSTGDYKLFVLNKDGSLGKKVPWSMQFQK